jgi:hypothetical protein
MVMTPDPHLNLRADIKATLQSIDARIRAGGNWRGTARIARDLAAKLEALADMDDSQGPRVRYQSAPRSPSSGHEWLGASRFDETPAAERVRKRQQGKRPVRIKTEVTELPPPALGPGA